MNEAELLRRSLFLPLYYTVTSLLVPLSLWAAWGIYSEPVRYRSLFPHHEARKQAIAVLLLTVLFFLPFFQLWVNQKILLASGMLYAFLIVPLMVGFVKPNILEQNSLIIRLNRKLRIFKINSISKLKQFVRTFCLFLICVKELCITLPYFYRSFVTFQVLTNQVVFFILAEKSLCPEETFLSLYLLLLFTVMMYIKKCIEVRFGSEFYQSHGFSNTDILVGIKKILLSTAFFVFFIIKASPPTHYVIICGMYFLFTEPRLEGEETLSDMVAFFQSDIFEQLEYLYLPLFVRLVCILTSLVLCLLSISKLPILVSTACYTNLYVPFTRLNNEILGPLEQEIKGLQAFRQPTAEELQKAGSMCPVCLDTMHISRITPCGHIFHSHCLRQCLTRSRNCPCCRTPIL